MAQFAAAAETRLLRVAWRDHDTGNGGILALLDLDFGLDNYPRHYIRP